ncbi:hypothetical protein DICPUDRAFT_34890 [Dictyostelium purpureum]|uniref:Uncharacterized protein n=1 Tax=Dictyostelium purpureum TaxID=5786 RepID=F0ZNF6_DICPU|nr:uncharacterized protein DICPUDRAFT_34890 [Dictyostelium purpureum]EGC34524.1 hypothetical protein DICPUDRAFT_34890 [Dictyostelium purpureum]|eukprot:XP_003288960.1 hypothetical protein DICPUDRAFT_34890 [Dictyostelium purpureum]
MLGRAIFDVTQLIKRTTKFGIHWSPVASRWGVVGVVAALYAVQPRILFKHLPIIGDNYLTQKDLDKMKQEQQEKNNN